ncbi:MAG: 1-deoxy-D-xylulose-5-phosphate reductoisomerase [bacterium]|nr:1-deoxy-D-xylulose-5-phosphate reductoisomerase [bacterium]
MTAVKRIALLGATGSIGKSTVDVVLRHRERLRITCVAGYRNAAELAATAKLCGATLAVIAQASAYRDLQRELSGSGIEARSGDDEVAALCSREDVDIVLNALVGAAGVKPTLTALDCRKPVALANKETLVCAGALVMARAKAQGTPILPVDSEHSALFQALVGETRSQVKRLLLTASGGPFRDLPLDDFAKITPESALQHPTWKMGPKVTIDSSTLVNKGLELIEAKWLFDAEPNELDVVIHPQSIVHSLVEYCDGSMKAQLSNPDMKLPIQYALSYPERWQSEWVPNDLSAIGTLTFQEVDREKFPAVGLALQAMAGSSGMAAVFNAADEVAVPAFLQREIGYRAIPRLIETALDEFDGATISNVAELFELDREVREWSKGFLPIFRSE